MAVVVPDLYPVYGVDKTHFRDLPSKIPGDHLRVFYYRRQADLHTDTLLTQCIFQVTGKKVQVDDSTVLEGLIAVTDPETGVAFKPAIIKISKDMHGASLSIGV